jgi:hypothetical protein
MNKYKIILHLCSSKTGSSAIQYFLRENNSEFKKKGIIYDNEFNILFNKINSPNVGNGFFLRNILTKNYDSEIFLNFLKHLKKTNYFFSTEYVSCNNLDFNKFKLFLRVLKKKGFLVHIIYVLRAPLSRWISMAKQMARHEKLEKFDISHYFNNVYPLAKDEYSNIKNLINYMRKDNLHFIEYQKNIVNKIFNLIEIINETKFNNIKISEEKINPSMSIFATYILSALGLKDPVSAKKYNKFFFNLNSEYDKIYNPLNEKNIKEVKTRLIKLNDLLNENGYNKISLCENEYYKNMFSKPNIAKYSLYFNMFETKIISKKIYQYAKDEEDLTGLILLFVYSLKHRLNNERNIILKKILKFNPVPKEFNNAKKKYLLKSYN